MRIVNESLLGQFRMTETCEWCRRRFPGVKMQPNHIFTRGAGRLDIRCNLTSLCGPWQNNCHNDYHAGVLTRFDLLAVVAVRDGVMQHTIEDVIHTLRRLPKGTAWAALPDHIRPFVENYDANRGCSTGKPVVFNDGLRL